MRIGIDMRPLQTANKSGIPTYVYNLTQALINEDDLNHYRLFYNALKNIDHFRLKPEKTNIKEVVIRIPNRILNATWDYLGVPPIELLLGNIDVFHATHFIAPPSRNARNVVTIHDLSFVKFPNMFTKEQGDIFTRRCIETCNKADIIISDSINTRQDIIELFSIPPEKIISIPLAARDIFRPIKEARLDSPLFGRYNLNKDYILFVGTIEPRKNLIRLIQAYSQLPEYLRKGYDLVIVGGKGWLSSDVYRESERLGLLRNSVQFLDYIQDEDLVYLVNAASVFVYPSLYEGFGLPPLEVMACGIPVISSNISSIPEVVGDAGILIDPYCVDALSGAIQRVLEDSELALELGQRGLLRSRLFSWEKTAKETLNVYKLVTHEFN